MINGANTMGDNLRERRYIRHPADIPIEYCFLNSTESLFDSLKDVSIGGLCFQTDNLIEPKQWLHLRIPVREDYFEIDAQVRWCQQRSDNGYYDVGVLFSNPKEAFSARMVEQVCHIEQYKREVLVKEGRTLSGDEAAAEWIAKFANQFPSS